MNNLTSASLLSFLRDTNCHEMHFTLSDHSGCLIKSHYDAETDFLFLLKNEHASPYGPDCHAVYAGIYSVLHDQVFDLHYFFRDMWEKLNNIRRVTLYQNVTQRVITAILRIIEEGPVAETAASEIPDHDLEYFLNNELENQAFKCFYERCTPSYIPDIIIRDMSTEQLVACINHIGAIVEMFAEEYITKNARLINQHLEAIPFLNRRIEELECTPGDHHTRRDILRSLHNEQTVRVLVDKCDKKLNIRIRSEAFKSITSRSYNISYMDPASRVAFIEAYGRLAELLPDDISMIRYKKRTLYRKLN